MPAPSPLRDHGDVVGGDALAVLIAKQVLEQDADREGEAVDRSDALLLKSGEPEVVVVGTADAQLRRCAKAIICH